MSRKIMWNLNRFGPKTMTHLPCYPHSEPMVLKRHKHWQAAKKWYQTLGVSKNCEDEELRLAFVHLAKKFHPDSGAPEADAALFSEIESAYRQIRKMRMEQKDRDQSAEIEEFDIKHTAPQHRHYLTHDVGIGTPNKRHRLHTIQRAHVAAENVMEHRLNKLQAGERNTLVGMDKLRAKDIKTRFGMDRLVEDLIQEAMNKGEFSDLPGMGKPLKENISSSNPYVDFTTHKLNQVLIENGFTPEWIQLSKEIREETQDLRKKLAEARDELGLLPLSLSDAESWRNVIQTIKETEKRINNKIDKYNLLVPILQKQMLRIKLEALAEEALSVSPRESTKKHSGKQQISETKHHPSASMLDFISDIFGKKVT